MFLKKKKKKNANALGRILFIVQVKKQTFQQSLHIENIQPGSGTFVGKAQVSVKTLTRASAVFK